MKNPAAAYQSTSFEAAPPLKILRMLYAGALKFIDQARKMELPADNVQFNDRLQRAEAIVSELRCSLDATQSPELASQLDSLYVYAASQISAGVLDREKAPLDNAHRILSSLKEAWDQLEVGDNEAKVA